MCKREGKRVQTGPDAYVNGCITEGNTSLSTSSEHPTVWVHQHAAMTFMQTCIKKVTLQTVNFCSHEGNRIFSDIKSISWIHIRDLDCLFTEVMEMTNR